MRSLPTVDAAHEPADDVSENVEASRRELLRLHGDSYRPILAILRDQPWKDLVSTRDLLELLEARGIDWSERTLRLYLAEMTDAGLLEREGRRGHRLAAAGLEAARGMTVSRRLGSILYRMEETMCQVSVDLGTGTGLVSINAYVIPISLLLPLVDALDTVFRAGLAVGSRVLFAEPGEDILGRTVPEGHIGLGTMCSLTLAGMLMRKGVPTHPIFGGLLRVEGGQPAHFLEMIRYDATSLSPNEDAGHNPVGPGPRQPDQRGPGCLHRQRGDHRQLQGGPPARPGQPAGGGGGMRCSRVPRDPPHRPPGPGCPEHPGPRRPGRGDPRHRVEPPGLPVGTGPPDGQPANGRSCPLRTPDPPR